MGTTVLDERRHFDRQTHAYAEYRVFSTLAGNGAPHREVTITLSRLDALDSGQGPVVCSVAVTLDSGGTANVEALDWHPSGAIDRAAACIARAVKRQAFGPPGRTGVPDPQESAATAGSGGRGGLE